MKRFAILLLAAPIAMAVAGCSIFRPSPEIVVVAHEQPPPMLPAECTQADKPWSELPDADVRRAEAARLWRVNRQRYAALIGSRRVCRAGIQALPQAAR